MFYKINIISVLMVVVAFAATGWAMSINDLLDAAVKQPGALVSELTVQENNLNHQAVTDELYPKLGLFAKGQWFDSPTNLRPMPPTEVNMQAGESIPFSRTIFRYGVELKMPIYARNLYMLRDKLNLLTKKAEIENRINLSARQAHVVSLNSSFQYLVGLDQAVLARLKSLEQTRRDVQIKVDNGRLPETELLKINNSLIALEQQKNDLETKKLDIKQNLKKLTGIDVNVPVKMELSDAIGKSDTFIGVKKDEMMLAAAQKEVALRKAAYFPVISLYGSLTGNDGKAYNTNDPIFRSYNSAGVVLQIPFFDKTLSTRSSIARVQVEKAQKKLADTKIQLKALAQNLDSKLPIIDRSLELARQSVENQEQLLKVAKISFDSGRETTEEYLRYESQVLASQAAVNKAMDQKWQIVAQQVVLYGTDLKGIIQ